MIEVFKKIYWKFISTFFYPKKIFVLGFFITFSILFFNSTFQTILSLYWQKNYLENSIEYHEAETEKIHSALENYNDKEYMKRRVRENTGLVYKDELIFHFYYEDKKIKNKK